MTPEITARKGARKVNDIPEDVLLLLNQGKIETVNLTEWLAIDHRTLIENVFPSIGIHSDTIDRITQKIEEQKKPSTMNTTKLVGSILHSSSHTTPNQNEVFENLKSHTSDSIRCYAPFLKSLDENLTIEEKLSQSKTLIADKHFGVREVVWMALRPEIEKHLETSIAVLSTWTLDADENIRRFTTESTRPRGVWCKHIEQLKENPALALPILDNLKSDPSKYVQDSVGNWLNDASKSDPKFVINICERWQKESLTKDTAKIIKRARRTIDKK